jgi:transketolase
MKAGGAFHDGGAAGRNVHFGVREHAMGSIANGMSYHGGIRPYTATFFVFSDYMRPAMRLAALSGLPVVHVFTHDSIGVGEDGPTHQPVEHLASLRAMPNLHVVRPGDPCETAEAWKYALERKGGPTVLVLSRQKVPMSIDVVPKGRCAGAEGLQRGGYVLFDPAGSEPAAILIATGTELGLALSAALKLEQAGVPTRVVSLPCFKLFFAQGDAYREAVLGPGTVRVGVEAAVRQGWEPLLGEAGGFVGMTGFGASAPGADLYRHFGLTPEAVAAAARARL